MTTETQEQTRTDAEEAELIQSSVDVNELDEVESDEDQPVESTSEETETEEDSESDKSDQETGISDAENHLIKIQNAAADVRIAQADIEESKLTLKNAKEHHEYKVTVLTNLIEATNNDANRPLFNQTEEEKIDDGWKAQPISVLWDSEPIKGFGSAKREAIVDEVGTLLGFLELMQKVGKDADHLSGLLPQGCGEKLADELETRFHDYTANWEPPKFDLQGLVDEVAGETEWRESIESDDDFEAGKADFMDGSTVPEMVEAVSELDESEREQWAKGYVVALEEYNVENPETAGESKESDGDEYEDVPDDGDGEDDSEPSNAGETPGL